MKEVNYLSRDKNGFAVWRFSPEYSQCGHFYHVHMIGQTWAAIPQNKVQTCCHIDPNTVGMNTVVQVKYFYNRGKSTVSFRIIKVDLDQQEV